MPVPERTRIKFDIKPSSEFRIFNRASYIAAAVESFSTTTRVFSCTRKCCRDIDILPVEIRCKDQLLTLRICHSRNADADHAECRLRMFADEYIDLFASEPQCVTSTRRRFKIALFGDLAIQGCQSDLRSANAQIYANKICLVIRKRQYARTPFLALGRPANLRE